MKVFIFLAVAISGVYQAKPASGLCYDKDEVLFMCSMNTTLQSKVVSAMITCNLTKIPTERDIEVQIDEMETVEDDLGMKWKPFVSCKKSCPPADRIKMKLMNMMHKELCLMKAIGWINKLGELIQDVIQADVSELPEAVVSKIDKNKIEPCAKRKVHNYQGKIIQAMYFKVAVCCKRACYSEDKMDVMVGLIKTGEYFDCFVDMLEKACTPYVREMLWGSLLEYYGLTETEVDGNHLTRVPVLETQS